MSVFVDPLCRCLVTKNWPYAMSCHLFADSLDELHDFAKRLGLRREWFQNHPRLKHYDLTGPKREKAVELGAIEASREQTVLRMREAEKVNEVQK